MRELTAEENILLHLLQRGLNENVKTLSGDVLSQANWQAIMEESRAQAVLVQTFDAAAVYKKYIPDEVYQEWFKLSLCILATNSRVLNAQRELVDLLKEKNYPYLILKGTAAGAYYSKPELRHQGDVDFLIGQNQKNEIEQYLLTNGYKSEMHDHICHVVLKKPGTHLEMHFEIAGIPYGAPGDKIRNYMKDALETYVEQKQDNQYFRAPDDAHHGLILLLHMQHHMVAEGLGLRHLCDWAFFIKRTQGKFFWEERLLPLLRQIGLLHYTKVMTKTCACYLGVICPEWAVDAEEELCNEVMVDVLTGGNFGRKEAARSKAGMMISDHGKDGVSKSAVHNLYRSLHKSTPVMYPVVKRMVFLHPILDVWRVILYLGKSVCGKRPSFAKMIPFAQERKSTYKKLRIFKVKETVGDENGQ